MNDMDISNYRMFTSKSEMQKSFNSLYGILLGMSFDGYINDNEFNELSNWYSLHRHLIDKHPYNEVLPIIDIALQDGKIDTNEMENILWLCEKFTKLYNEVYFNAITTDIQHLEGIMYGIVADNKILDDEIYKLSDWLSSHLHLSGIYPYDEIYTLLQEIISDGIITEHEQNMLKSFFLTFVDTKESFNINEKQVQQLQEQFSIGGICSINPKIEFKNKMFCFTGESIKAKRSEIAKIIENIGGIFKNDVTKKTDYLIIGAEGNPCWTFACYGRKVEKALNLRKQGNIILLINERDFWTALKKIEGYNDE